MGRNAISVRIPEKVWERFVERFDELYPETPPLSKIGKVVYVFDHYFDSLPPEKFAWFQQNTKTPTPSLIYRALRSTRGRGATCYFREALALFISGGKQNWLSLIRKEFPDDYGKHLSAFEIDNLPKHLKDEVLAQQVARRISSASEKAEARAVISEAGRHEEELPEFLASWKPLRHDPRTPEFPPRPYSNPRFPASDTFQLPIPGYSEVWLKDESSNPCGSHKDRMAWEIVDRAYRYCQREKHFPTYSMISSGSAAFSVQFFLKLYYVPTNLHVIVDESVPEDVVRALERIKCVVTPYDLSKECLDSQRIRELSKNLNGIDITYRETTDIFWTQYYDWLAYEILNLDPEFCIVPFGTGDLFMNILKILEQEVDNGRLGKHDRRFAGNMRVLPRCNFIAATSRTIGSKFDKLYSHYLPHLRDYEVYIENLKSRHVIGPLSQIAHVTESHLDSAFSIINAVNGQSGALIRSEPSGLSGLALFLQEADRFTIPRDAKVAIVNTGSTRFDLDFRPLKEKYKSFFADFIAHPVSARA